MVVNGDLGLPGLGLSPEDRSALTRDVHFIIHSAASISFVDHIHRLIAHNYIVRTSPSLPTLPSAVCVCLVKCMLCCLL